MIILYAESTEKQSCQRERPWTAYRTLMALSERTGIPTPTNTMLDQNQPARRPDKSSQYMCIPPTQTQRKKHPELKERTKKKVSKENLRKHHRLAIQRPSISPNALPPKHALDVNPPRFVETNSPPLHDHIHIPLRILIQSSPRV